MIRERLGVFLDALARTFFEMRLHEHRVLEIFELLPNAFKRGIDPRITAQWNLRWF